ncbi:hypothetical protein [Bacillus cereus]|jgi:hypothetical protein|uniref:hypothetical protein n=1 Tax=Bacillus cereus TaxID=1396 RepID=UPI0002FCADBC|nr:hypothetical protein [Bacillus cereus]MCU4733618.1 hypothetical protein [Bacillus cereus]MCU5149236.1 hypothetical protein [Bacillus cereus]MCU5496250.1 hypothetical protein [Bacillus cereus]MCU5639329.1 hypothetical protein [Bacillus cereus]MCU5702274.1 hypothetical protein [Bacillus cereus]
MLDFKENKNVTSCNYDDLLQLFNHTIRKSLRNTPYQEREDLEQEIKIKIYEKINVIEELPIPGFFDFIKSKDNGVI